MEKNKIFESLIRCLLSNILVSFLLFIRIRETRENETKRRKKERLIRDSDIILINRQNNRPTDNRYFSKFYARSIFFPLLGYLTSSTLVQILSPQTILLLHFANRSGHRVLADHFWKILSQIPTKTLFPLTFNEHLSNKHSTSCNLCCRYNYRYFVEFPFLLFAFNDVLSCRFLIVEHPSESIFYLVSKMLKINRQSCN